MVIERRRRDGEKDGLLWFCENCNHKLYEEYFGLQEHRNGLSTCICPLLRVGGVAHLQKLRHRNATARQTRIMSAARLRPIFSFAFNPLFMPLFGMVWILYYGQSAETELMHPLMKRYLLAITAVFCSLLPLFTLVLMKLFGLTEKLELPGAAIACYPLPYRPCMPHSGFTSSAASRTRIRFFTCCLWAVPLCCWWRWCLPPASRSASI